jgi:hypothetical protein
VGALERSDDADTGHRRAKRAYEAPGLSTHGDLRKLTTGGGGFKNEPEGSGNPGTRQTGANP